MQAIKCELCGSNEFTKVDGLFQCNHCNTKYTLEEAKKLIVSGTVEVVTGNAENERLLKIAETYIRIGQLMRAYKVFEKITIEFPNDHRGWIGLARVEEANIYNIFKKVEDNFLDIYNSKNISILGHLKSINKIRNVLKVISTENTYKIDSIENNILNHYNAIPELPLVNAISSEIICHYQEVQEFSEKMHLWAEDLTNNFISSVFTGKSSFQSLFKLSYGIDKDEVVCLNNYDKGNQKFNELFLIGKQCGKFINSHRYVLEDIALDNMSISACSEEILFAFGNTLSVISDREYGTSTTEYKIATIESIEVLQKIANKKNKNNYCFKCGGKLQGVFKKVCSKCGKPKDY